MKGGFNSTQMKRAIAVAIENKNVIYLINKTDSNVVYKISNAEKVNYGKNNTSTTIKLGHVQACKLNNPKKTSTGEYDYDGKTECTSSSNPNISNFLIEVPLASTSLIVLEKPEFENAVVQVQTQVVDEPTQLIDHVKKDLGLKDDITYSTALVMTGYAKDDPESLSKPPVGTIKEKICNAVSSLTQDIKSDNSKLFRNLAKTFRAQGLKPNPENTAVFQELVNKKSMLSTYVADCQGSVNTTTADSNPVSKPTASTKSTPASNVSPSVNQ